MTQAGGSLNINEAGGDFYDIFQSPAADANGEYHKYISILPQNIGSNVDNTNAVGSKYVFPIPEGIYATTDSYFTVEATLSNTVADGTKTVVGTYAPGAAGTRTHITIQNGACSFFGNAEMHHNSNQVEQILKPGLCEMVDALCGTQGVAKSGEDTNFTFINRCPTFEGAGGDEYTIANNLGNLNRTTYDPSFESRCRITGGGPFQISGKLPFSLFTYRSVATYLANASVELTRAADSDIIENRNTTVGDMASIVINKITLWMHKVTPALDVFATILDGIKNGDHQSIAGKRWQHTEKDIPATLLEPSFQQTLTNRPSKIFVGFRRTNNQRSRRTWNHNNIANVTVRLGDRIINDATLNVRSWATKANETHAVYQHFIATTGQGGVFGEPCLSYEQFANNYTLWAFDTSPSATNSTVLAKEPTELNVNARVLEAVALTMDIFVCYDGMYSIAGPSGMPT